jgi:hypothetical protein
MLTPGVARFQRAGENPAIGACGSSAGAAPGEKKMVGKKIREGREK